MIIADFYKIMSDSDSIQTISIFLLKSRAKNVSPVKEMCIYKKQRIRNADLRNRDSILRSRGVGTMSDIITFSEVVVLQKSSKIIFYHVY